MGGEFLCERDCALERQMRGGIAVRGHLLDREIRGIHCDIVF